MVHGEEHAKAAYASAGQRAGLTNGRAIGEAVNMRSADPRPLSQRPTGTVSGIIATAESAHSMAMDRLGGLNALSSRAADLVTRLGGSYPTVGPTDGQVERADRPDDPASALDAAQQRVGEIRRPLQAMDPLLDRLANALDALERTLG